MKIPLFYIPKTKYKYFLEIKHKYSCSKYIIPIGRDCHAAHTLQVLELRHQSLPYDWIRLKAQLGLNIVSSNIRERFNFFLENLHQNEEGNTYAEKYPNAEFTHAKAVLHDVSLRNKFKIRAQRMLDIIDNQDVAYLHILEIQTFKNDDFKIFIKSIQKFIEILKHNDSLHIYMRYDNTLENPDIAKNIMESIEKLPKVYVCTYNRNKEKYGIWGNPKYYPLLMKDVGIQLKRNFPSFRIVS